MAIKVMKHIISRSNLSLRPAYDVIFIIIIILACVICVSEYNFRIRGPADYFRESIECFILSLTVFHIYFIIGSYRHSKNITKYIDYVYLSIAALGLLSAVDLSISRYHNSVEGVLSYVNGRMLHNSMELSSLINSRCMVNTSGKDCATANAINEKIKKLNLYIDSEIHKEKLSYPSTALFNVRNQLTAMANIRKRITSDLYWGVDEKELISLANYTEEYRTPPFGSGMVVDTDTSFERTFDARGLKQLGYLLIAAALGLRITRVTVEIWELWRK